MNTKRMAEAADAAWALDQVQALSQRSTADRLTVAKQIAAVALFMQARQDLPPEPAMRVAAAAFEAATRPTRGGLKKALSEARAIFQFGLTTEAVEALRQCAPGELVAAIHRQLVAVSLREVTHARARQLGGVRGGRPSTRGKPAYAAVQKLLVGAEAGDTAAQAELTAIQDLVSPPPARAGNAEHRRATSR